MAIMRGGITTARAEATGILLTGNPTADRNRPVRIEHASDLARRKDSLLLAHLASWRLIIAEPADGREARSRRRSAGLASRPACRSSPSRRAGRAFPPAQAGELGVERVIGHQERLLAVQDRRVRAGGVFQAIDLAGAERELDAPQQGRVRVGFELGVDQVRDLAGLAVELDQVGPLDLAQVGPGASLVDAEQRVERLERGAVDIEGVGQQLAGSLLAKRDL